MFVVVTTATVGAAVDPRSIPHLSMLLSRAYLISNSHMPPQRSPSLASQYSTLGRQQFQYYLHCNRVECSEYLCRRSIPSFIFSNPLKIPERTRLKRSAGFTNPIKYRRTSSFTDDKSIINVWIHQKVALSHCTHKDTTLFFGNSTATDTISGAVPTFDPGGTACDRLEMKNRRQETKKRHN
jgi:hypothetical protein